MKRRDLLKAGVATGGLVAFAAGYSRTAQHVIENVGESLAPRAKASNLHGRSLPPEYAVDMKTGALTLNADQQVSYAMCLGCTTLCGVRVRIDKKTGHVLRVSGNPYSPLSTDPALPYETPVKDSFLSVSRVAERGLNGRSTVCGRGAAVLSQVDSPFRVLQPLKRVGPRNSGKWEPISFEQLVREVVEGGDLFGEGRVEGLKTLRSFDPIDPQAPELGPKANQVALLSSVNEGREPFARRFMQQAFGTINFVGHGGYCGGSYRSGSGAAFGDLRTMPHAKPDFANAEFVIFAGTAPANAGNPFKLQGAQLAKERTDGGLNYVVVDPVLGHSDSAAARQHGRWIPIRPGTDSALALGMMRWMIENGRCDERYLSAAGPLAAQKIGEPSFSNAAHLVIAEPGHPREGFFLRGSDLGLPLAEGAQRYTDKDPFVVIDRDTQAPIAHDKATEPAALFVDQAVEIEGKRLRVRSPMALLKASAFAKSLDDYAEICGIPADIIAALAKEFTSHGKKAAVSTHGGTMAGNGFYSAFSLVTLNTLIGNLHWKGGTFIAGGAFRHEGSGPRYNLESFEGMVQPRGLTLSRNNQPYERSSEFKRKREAGKPAYPAEQPWYPNGPQLGTEWLTSALQAYPYGLKALILWNTNPIYGIPGVEKQVREALKDPTRLPLIIAIDPFINETGAYADYIVPDSVLYESWGWASPWAGVPTRSSTARWPVIDSKTAKGPDGDPIGMESFFIACAKAMGMPGFGVNAMKDAEGNPVALERTSDWYLRGGANIAFAGKQPVADASDDDLAFVGLDRLRGDFERALKPDEWRKVAAVLARGGRYQNASATYQGEKFADRPVRMLHVYNEWLGTSRSAVTGQRFSGVPIWMPPSFADGSAMRAHHPEKDWPFLLVSQKSVLMNSYSIGADQLRQIHSHNPVALHVEDARRLGVRTGDRVRIGTPGGAVIGTAIVRRGVMKGVIAVEHGFGHRELGARAHIIGETRQPSRPELAAGINLNDLGIPDPTRKGLSVWLDPVAGSSVRQGIPARIARV